LDLKYYCKRYFIWFWDYR